MWCRPHTYTQNPLFKRVSLRTIFDEYLLDRLLLTFFCGLFPDLEKQLIFKNSPSVVIKWMTCSSSPDIRGSSSAPKLKSSAA